jgi:hypothetical protein
MRIWYGYQGATLSYAARPMRGGGFGRGLLGRAGSFGNCARKTEPAL